MKAILFIMVALFLSLLACVKDKYTDDPFTLNRIDYDGDQLKTDGYYYSAVEGENYYRLYVFYRNGVVFIPGVDENPDSYIYSLSLDTTLGRTKNIWGLFQIEANDISIEYYLPKMIEGRPAYLKSGNILNDTTFVINEIERSQDGSEHRVVNETYHYKHFSPKPDSTNNFFK